VENLEVKRKILLPLILTALVSATLLAAVPRAHAQGTTLMIVPASSTYYLQTSPAGTKFKLNITVDNVTNLFSWQVNVSWNPALLNYSDITLPSDHVFAGQTFYPVPPAVENGSVVYGVALGAVTANTFNGTGTLAQLELEILAQTALPVTCNVTFERITVTPADTFLLDRDGADITFTAEVGVYNYMVQELVTHLIVRPEQNYTVTTLSNTTIYPNTAVYNNNTYTLSFNATGPSGAVGYVNVTIPLALVNTAGNNSAWTFKVNGTAPLSQQVVNDSTNTYVYLTFNTSTELVEITGTVPEFQSIFLMLLVTSSVVAVAVKIRSRRK
jgi:hypothetical protein